MRRLITNVTLVSLLSILLFQATSHPTSCIPASHAHDIKDVTKICSVESTELIEGLSVERRAGGKVGGGGSNDGLDPPGGARPGVGEGGGAGGPSSEGGATDTTGEGGMDQSEGTTGGMGAAPEELAPVQPAPAAPEFPPSARNNQNQPATTAQMKFDLAAQKLPEIDVDAVVRDMLEQVRLQGLEGSSWYFFDGLEDMDIYLNTVRPILSKRLGFGTDDQGNQILIPSLQNIKKQKVTDDNAIRYEDAAEFLIYFWNAYSKAYAQAVSGKAYVVIPKDRPINQPFEDKKGSWWWSFEVPELTRNPNVDEIYVVRIDPTLTITLEGEVYDLDDPVLIWRKGDEPIGFPADIRYEAAFPSDPFNPEPITL